MLLYLWFSVEFSTLLFIFLRLRVFDSGVMVVQLQSHSEEEMIASAIDNVSVILHILLNRLELAIHTSAPLLYIMFN